MYKVTLYHYRDGFEQDFPTAASRVLYDDTKLDDTRTIFDPVVKNSITELSSFEFSILPSHPLYEELIKFKSIITVYRNSTVLFHGRVIHDGVDFYGQRQISCEGALGFLLDTWTPGVNLANTTPKAFLAAMISNHNSEVTSRGTTNEPYKRFTVGNVTVTVKKDGTDYPADDSHVAKRFKFDSYTQTKSAIESNLINEYKGFLFSRYDGSTLYIDWLKSFSRVNNQPVKMAVNLLDRTFEENTDDFYTVLMPLGDKKVTIESVNNGSKYLENATAVAKYGRIVKVEQFSDCKTAASLLSKAREEFNKHGSELPSSWRIKAVDMYMLGDNVPEILIGDQLTNLEDRTGALISGVTVVEASYNLFDPSQDEYTVENQEAIDQRNNSDRGNGTLSGRTGGISGALDGDTRNFKASYDTYQLTVQDWYDLTAASITERSQQHNIITGILNATYDEGYFDAFSGENIKEVKITKDDGTEETVYVQALAGSRVHQDDSGIVSYVQDISGIRMNRIKTVSPESLPDGASEASEFDENKSYAVGDFCTRTTATEISYYQFTKAHPAGPWIGTDAEKLSGQTTYIYEPVYKTDSQGNEFYDLITGEAVYETIDDVEENSVHIPLRSIARQTRDEFIQVVGSTDISRVLDLPDGAKGAEDFSASKSYAVGDYCYHKDSNGDRILYRFTTAHTGAWNATHVVAVDIQTIQKMSGSTLWQKENDIVAVVGEVEVTSIVPPQASEATAFSESVTYNAGSYVWYPPTGKDRGLYEFTKTHRAGPWLGTDVKQITTKTVVIKNGTGLQVVKDGVGVGLFKDGEIDAGLIVESLNNGETEAKIKASRVDIKSTSGSGIEIDQNGNIIVNVADVVNGINTNAALRINANRINLTSGAVIKAINGGESGSSELTIDADKLNLEGWLETYGISVQEGQGYIETGTVQAIEVYSDSVDTGWVGSEDGHFDSLSIDSLTLGKNSETPFASVLIAASVDGNTLTITRSDGTSVNFSKATTLNGGWSSGVFTVNALQNNENVGSYTTTITQGATTWDGTTATVPVMATDSTSGGYSYSTGRNITVNASAIAGIASIENYANSTDPSDYADWSGTSVGTLAEDTYYLFRATPNHGNPMFIKFKTAASSGGQGGIASVTAGGWTWANNTYTNTVTATANDGASDTVDVGLPTITCQVGTGTSSNATIRPYGPGNHILPTGTSLTLYLKSDDEHVYLTNTNAQPTPGDSTVVAQANNPAYSSGQTAAGVSINASNKTVERALSSSTKAVEISAVASLSYNSTTHKYTAFATAKAANTEMDSDSAVSGTQAYDAGWAAAYDKVTLPSAMTTTSNNLVTVYTPPSTVDGTRVGTNLYLVCDDNYAYIRSVNATSGGSTYARITNPSQGGNVTINAASRTSQGDEATVISGTDSSIGSAGYKYMVVTATASNGATRTIGVNMEPTYTAGYNAGLPNSLSTSGANGYTATTDVGSITANLSGGGYIYTAGTGATGADGVAYLIVKLTATDANGNVIKERYAYNKTGPTSIYKKGYVTGYNNAPVGLAADAVVYRTGESTNSEATYNGWTGHSDTINMSTYKYRRYDINAKDGSSIICRVHAEGVYNAGWAAAYGKVTLPSAMTVTSNNLVTVKTPPSTVDGTATTTNLYLVCADDYVYIRSANSATSGTMYARIENTKSGSVSASAIDLYVLGTTTTKPTTSTHPGYTSIVQMNTLIGLIDLYKNSTTTRYIPFEAKLTSGGTGNKKLYYISVGGSSD